MAQTTLFENLLWWIGSTIVITFVRFVVVAIMNPILPPLGLPLLPYFDFPGPAIGGIAVVIANISIRRARTDIV